MSFLISEAWAEGAGAAADPIQGVLSFLPVVLIFIVFWFLLIRPQMKRAKEHKKMVETLSKQDEVVTTGGLLGKITRLDDNFAVLEISEGVEVKVQRSSIASQLPKGTLKS